MLRLRLDRMNIIQQHLHKILASIMLNYIEHPVGVSGKEPAAQVQSSRDQEDVRPCDKSR